jgi:hypothetical protein
LQPFYKHTTKGAQKLLFFVPYWNNFGTFVVNSHTTNSIKAMNKNVKKGRRFKKGGRADDQAVKKQTLFV